MNQDENRKLLHGVLDTLLLRLLAQQPGHGYALCERIREGSNGEISLNESGVYTALYRLEEQGLVSVKRGTSSHGRNTKIYSLTNRGKTQLGLRLKKWSSFSAAVSSILGQDDITEIAAHG